MDRPSELQGSGEATLFSLFYQFKNMEQLIAKCRTHVSLNTGQSAFAYGCV